MTLSPEFLAQLEGVRKRAERERSVITGLHWRHGHLRADLRKRRDVEREARESERPTSLRGVQGELL